MWSRRLRRRAGAVARPASGPHRPGLGGNASPCRARARVQKSKSAEVRLRLSVVLKATGRHGVAWTKALTIRRPVHPSIWVCSTTWQASAPSPAQAPTCLDIGRRGESLLHMRSTLRLRQRTVASSVEC
eukprot:scaffold52280_cov61-Phaeocystis_antarctica.AAC.4